MSERRKQQPEQTDKQTNPNTPGGMNNRNNGNGKWRAFLRMMVYVIAVFLVVGWFFGDKEEKDEKKSEISYTKFVLKETWWRRSWYMTTTLPR